MCNKNLCEICYIYHKTHKYVFCLNHIDMSKSDREDVYIKKPKNSNESIIINCIILAKKFMKKISDEKIINNLSKRIYELQKI